MTEKIPKRSRRTLVLRTARDFIIRSGITSLPVDVYKLFEMYGWTLVTLDSAEKHCNRIDPFDFRYDPDCDAVTFLRSGRYLTVYKEWVYPKERILWTLAHEIAHIVLKHLENYEETDTHNILTESQYKVLEREANYFAAELLAPLIILKSCGCRDIPHIMKLCGVSYEAASYTLDNLKSKKSVDASEIRLHAHFMRFINDATNGKKVKPMILVSDDRDILLREFSKNEA